MKKVLIISEILYPSNVVGRVRPTKDSQVFDKIWICG